MKSYRNNLIAVILISMGFLFSLSNPLFAKNRYRDLYTVPVESEKFRYFSSPEYSGYIKPLPKNYVHAFTEIIDTIEPLNLQMGEEIKLKTVEPINLSDFLTIPQGSIISGRVVELVRAKKFIKNSRVCIVFNKLTTPGGFEFTLNEQTFQVMPLTFMKGSRYATAIEFWYGAFLGGAKYPISRYLNIPISYAIGGGAGLVSGIVYGKILDNVPKYTGVGFLRGLGAKIIHNVFFLTGKTFTVKSGTPIMLAVKTDHVEDLRYLPEYINIQQLMMASSLSNNKKIDKKLISKSANSNTNATEIINFYEESVNNNPENIENKLNLGKTYIKSGRYEKAIQFFSEILSSLPDNPDVQFHLARALEESGKLEQAMEYYQMALKNKYSDKEILLKIGNLYNKMGNSTEAAIYFDKFNDSALVLK